MLNLRPEDHWSQRNNKIRYMSACMPTSKVMFNIGNGIKFENTSDLAHDDYFMWLLNTDEAKEYCYNKYKWAFPKFPPNEVHGMYSTYLDIIVSGKKVSDFKLGLSYNDYVDRIKDGQIIMTSTILGGLDGHAVCFIGFDRSEFIIADPWGNFRNYKNYKPGDGYAVKLSYEEWLAYIKPVGEDKKWGHVIL